MVRVGNRKSEVRMRLEVRIHAAALDDSLRAYIDRRLRFAVGRLGERVGQVKVGISDLNGPRGGVDKCCRVSVTLVPRGRVVVEEVDSDLYTAIDRAAERLGRSCTRRLQRARELKIGRESIRAGSGLPWFLLQ